jgi:hypothetical protein
MKWNQKSGMASQREGKKQIAAESLAGKHLESMCSFLFFFAFFYYVRTKMANISGEEDKQMGRT